MQDLDILKQGQALRLAADGVLFSTLINHLESAGEAIIAVPEHASLGCWLTLYHKALSRPHLHEWARRLPLDFSAYSTAPGLQLPAREVMKCYGFPYPRHRGERWVITQALHQSNSFADTSAGLSAQLARLDKDLLRLADTLQRLLADDDFNLFHVYKTYLKLDSGSFWATQQQAGAELLTTLTTTAEFLALEAVQALQPDVYAFDPATRRLTGRNELGTPVDLEIDTLLALPDQDVLRQLIEVAERLGTFVHQSAEFSLAQLLKCHDLPVPGTEEEAQALIDQLRRWPALPLPPVSDLAGSDVALMQYLQWLALDDERGVMAVQLKSLIEAQHSDALIDTAGVMLVPAADANQRHPAVSAGPASPPMSLEQRLQHHGVNVPTTVDEALEILAILHMNPPRPWPLGDYHTLLNTSAPVHLDAAQRQLINDLLTDKRPPDSPPRLLDRLRGDLLAGLHIDEVRTQANHLLPQLLGLAAAQQLGKQLVDALHWYGQRTEEAASEGSCRLLVLSALILDLDVGAAHDRYTVAGFDLAGSANWGKSHADIRRDFEWHLVQECSVSSIAAPLAAHVLLAGAAPEFLVQGLPASVRFRTSIAWMSFKQGVMIAQAMAPGSAQHLSYDDMLALATQTPTTAEQQQWREYTATSTLLDWAIAQGELPERDNGRYQTAEIDTLKKRLSQRLHDLKQALVIFSSKPTTRRRIALADLQRVFPKHPLLETACLWRPVAPLASSSLRFPMHQHDRQNYSLHSLVELHMDGLLEDHRWQSIDPGLDLVQLRPQFAQLRVVSDAFDKRFDAYIERTQHAYATLIEDLLAQLPPADRTFLHSADLQLLVLKKELDKDVALLSQAEEISRTARTGVILRGTSATQVNEYELFPLLNQVYKRSGPPLKFNPGGTRITVTTGSAQSTHPVTQLLTGDNLPLDWEAYANGRPPRKGMHTKVIVEVLWSSGRPPTDPPEPVLTFGSPVTRAIAQAIVHKHFLLDVNALRQQARGATQREQRQQRWDQIAHRLKALVPFWSCGEDITSGDTRRAVAGAYGCLLDLLAVVFPTRQFVSASLSVLKKTAPLTTKLLQLGRVGSTFLLSVLNPLDGVSSVFRLAGSGLIRLSANAWQVVGQAIEQVRHGLAATRLLDYPRLLARAAIGNGSVLRGGDWLRINALLHKHHWYACHRFTTRPYGPPLVNFRLDGALGVTSMRAANGYEASVSDRLFSEPPLVIPRANATDLLDGDRLLRLEHSAPTHFDDLTSAAYFTVLQDFDTLCPDTRKKRSPVPLICFTKKLVAFNASIHQRRVQAIEHIRLIPAPANGPDMRKLVYNRRVYQAKPVSQAFELEPVAMDAPLTYEPQVSGRLIYNEPQFGLPNNQLDTRLNRETRVVELMGITRDVNDQRTLRAIAVNLGQTGAPADVRIVVEADAGMFYEAPHPGAPIAASTPLSFNQLDFSRGGEDERMIRGFSQRKLDYLNAGGYSHERPLVNLPTLEVLHRQLRDRHFSQAKLARLRAQAQGLKTIKQRELLLNASDQGQRMGMDIAVAPVRLDTWPPNPKPAVPLNQYLAEQANASTTTMVRSTGIGSANVVGTGEAEMRRVDIAEPLVMWQYSRVGQPNYTEVILRTGAGNCDQMAHIACEMIRFNGGTARIWGMTPAAHAFVVVGTPPAHLVNTVAFTEAGWVDLWICDPWTEIVCPAADYMRLLNEKMISWHLQDISVFFNDHGKYRWGQANDRTWLALLNRGTKHPLF